MCLAAPQVHISQLAGSLILWTRAWTILPPPCCTAGRSLPTPPSRRRGGRQPEVPAGGSCCRLGISVRASWRGAALRQARCRGSIQSHNRNNPKRQIRHRPSYTSHSILREALLVCLPSPPLPRRLLRRVCAALIFHYKGNSPGKFGHRRVAVPLASRFDRVYGSFLVHCVADGARNVRLSQAWCPWKKRQRDPRPAERRASSNPSGL